MYAGGKTRRRQRSRQQIAVMDRQPDAVAVADVEIWMRCKKSLRLGGGRVAKAVDIMVAVALGVDDADQRTEREVLLHAEPGLTGQVLTGDEESFIVPAPSGRSRGVDDRLVDPLAGFGRD